MNKYTILIYALIVGAAVISSVYKKMKKASNQGNNQQKKPVSTYQQPKPNYQKPQSNQPKTLEDILKSLMDETKPPVVKAPEVHKQLVLSDKEPSKFTTLDESLAFEKIEKDYYAQDTELGFDNDKKDYDELTDHHVHGAGFDDMNNMIEAEEKGEWDNVDWRKAVISAEILRRPEW
jgi:hypothetical protein